MGQPAVDGGKRPATAFTVVPVAVAWLMAVGVDLLFNAGVFSSLFDQSREPALLEDDELFRRIPVAYLALLAGVAAVAWLLDHIRRSGVVVGLTVGAAGGAVTAGLGVVSLWTAVELTAVFVLAAVLVQAVQFATAGAVLGGFQVRANRRRLVLVAVGGFVLCVLAAIVTQNLSGGFG